MIKLRVEGLPEEVDAFTEGLEPFCDVFSKSEPYANARAEREAYYARKKAERESRAERIDQLLRDNSTYKTAQKAFFAAIHQGDGREMKRCDDVMQRVKEKIEASFPKMELTCKLCCDSGELPDGKWCTCWMKARKRR